MPSTLLDAKNSEIPILLGILPTDPRFLRYLNNAQQRLINKGRWWGTYKRVDICAENGCWIQPSEIAVIEALEFMGRIAPIQNGWWQFREDVPPPNFKSCQCFRERLLDRGTTPVGTQPSSPSEFRVYAVDAADVGKTILVQGLDQNGVVIRNHDGSGNWFDGEILTLVAPPGFATSITLFSKVTGIQKQVTTNRVIANYVDPISLVETLAATYQWNDTNPAFRRFALTKFPGVNAVNPVSADICPAPPSCASGTYGATFIASLAFTPARVDSDWLVIGNLQALSDMAVSLFKKERGNEEEANVLEARAVHELRAELRKYTGDRTTVWADVQGSARLCRVTGGFI